MTNKEAIEQLLIIKDSLMNCGGCDGARQSLTCIYLAIKALEERPTGYWFLLDECSNEGVYCSNCRKKVYRVEYANQKVKSNYCPNCGARMEEKNNGTI